jgi:hypothetical protein
MEINADEKVCFLNSSPQRALLAPSVAAYCRTNAVA